MLLLDGSSVIASCDAGMTLEVVVLVRTKSLVAIEVKRMSFWKRSR
jgi:hypothetical protein